MREAPSEAKLASHKLLYKAGYIRDLVSGRYSLLPLGERVAKNIIEIIEEEMDRIGAQRVTTPTFHPFELWERSGRSKTMSDVLTTVKDKRGAQFALGATHEEVFVDLVEKFSPSEKDLPIVLYQFSNKFRDETRARGGLIRVREFVMKDAYSFHANSESLDRTYEDMFKAYERIFERLGIKAVAVEADSGAIGGKVSHEFMAESSDGEDTYVKCDSCGYSANTEKAEFVRENINTDEELRPLQIVDQPEWVETMDDNVKHYGFPKSHYLKNVVYKNEKGEIIIGVLRGDLDVSEVKLCRATGSSVLTEATDLDLKKIGTKSGWVHSWGHTGARYIADLSLATVRNLIGGQKEKTTDSINVNYGRDFTAEKEADIAAVAEGYKCAKCFDGKYVIKKGIEVGHVFRLDLFYSESMNATFIASDGTKKKFLMGCYGIGIERNLATIVEQNHDEKGIIWPKAVSPYDVYLISLRVNDKAQKVYEELKKAGVEVLYDDRDVSPGIKFTDYELIGIPIRLVISEKTGDRIEFKERGSSEIKLLSLEEIITLLR